MFWSENSCKTSERWPQFTIPYSSRVHISFFLRQHDPISEFLFGCIPYIILYIYIYYCYYYYCFIIIVLLLLFYYYDYYYYCYCFIIIVLLLSLLLLIIIIVMYWLNTYIYIYFFYICIVICQFNLQHLFFHCGEEIPRLMALVGGVSASDLGNKARRFALRRAKPPWNMAKLMGVMSFIVI
jgi:hypothetical protein